MWVAFIHVTKRILIVYVQTGNFTLNFIKFLLASYEGIKYDYGM